MSLKEKARSAIGENRSVAESVQTGESSSSEKPLEQVFTKKLDGEEPGPDALEMTTSEAIAVIESSDIGAFSASPKGDEEFSTVVPADDSNKVSESKGDPTALAKEKAVIDSELHAPTAVPPAKKMAVFTTPASRETTNRNAQEKIIMNAVTSLTEKQSSELTRMLDSKSPLYKTESELATAQNAIQLTEDLVSSGRVSSNLHESFEVIGDIVIRGTGASIWGPVTGNIYVEGDGVLYLTQTAKIQGNIFASHIVCEGSVDGEIRCSKMIATPNAVLKADIRYAEYFNPAMGADLDGSIKKDPNAMSDIKSPGKKTGTKSTFEKDIASFNS